MQQLRTNLASIAVSLVLTATVVAALADSGHGAIDLALQAGESTAYEAVAVDGIEQASQRLAPAPMHAAVRAVRLGLDQQRRHPVEIVRLKQAPAARVSVPGATVPLEDGVGHLQHSEGEAVVDCERSELRRLLVADAYGRVRPILVVAVEEVEFGSSTLTVLLLVAPPAQLLARVARVHAAATLLDWLAQEDRVFHIRAGCVVALAGQLVRNKLSDVVPDGLGQPGERVGTCVGGPRAGEDTRGRARADRRRSARLGRAWQGTAGLTRVMSEAGKGRCGQE